jgi:DNA-binding transcriptional ArsR family regulator
MSQQTSAQLRFTAQVFHALSASDRLEILDFLRDGEKCVCEIVPHLNLVQPIVSRHLRILKNCGIVSYRKEGTKRLYSITDQKIFLIIDGITTELVHTFTTKMLEQIF